MNIQLLCETETCEMFTALCQSKGMVHNPESNLALVQTDINGMQRLELRKLNEPKFGSVYVDFVHGKMAHRRKFGGGRGESIVKAIGIKGEKYPTVIDATAGLGRDAFVLASIGCQVRLIERNPIVFLLLQDGLQRAYNDPEIGEMMRQNMQLLTVNQLVELDPSIDYADVVYLDPMYPHKQKSALVKKEMYLFQHLVGADSDADRLLAPALDIARNRVVVKRPNYAEFLAEKQPHFSRESKSHRFDIYSVLI